MVDIFAGQDDDTDTELTDKGSSHSRKMLDQRRTLVMDLFQKGGYYPSGIKKNPVVHTNKTKNIKIQRNKKNNNIKKKKSEQQVNKSLYLTDCRNIEWTATVCDDRNCVMTRLLYFKR